MEGDGGLSSSRTALDDEGAGEIGADDGVLLALDRRDDVAHVAGEARHATAQRAARRRLAARATSSPE